MAIFHNICNSICDLPSSECYKNWLAVKNHVDHYMYNMSLGASYWVPLCGTGLLGRGWWISSHLSWAHIHHQDSISICRRSYKPQCICNVSLSSDSVHWESLFSAATGSNGSYFPGKYLCNCVNCRIYSVSHFFLPFVFCHHPFCHLWLFFLTS